MTVQPRTPLTLLAQLLTPLLTTGVALVATGAPALGQQLAESLYVPAQDGTRLAVDVYLPDDLEPEERVPALLELTRYWRGAEDPTTGEPTNSLRGIDRFFLRHGYALVKVDVRGSGASFGTRPAEYGPEEVRDGHAVVEWVVGRPWCSGAVGAFGTSYTGTTAELLAASGHPAVRAVIPGWSDFDVYRSPARPYGLVASAFLSQWSELVGRLDANEPNLFGGAVRRVRADGDGELRAAAVEEHLANPDVLATIQDALYRDQPLGASEVSLAQCSSLHWKKQIEASGVPMLVFASWLDAGTAGGALQRLRHYSNPQKLVILASSHGGFAHASPYVVTRTPRAPLPPVDEQLELRLAFFDQHLKGEEHGVEEWPAVRYHNLGEERLLESDVWPPAGVERRRWFLSAEGLSRAAPSGPAETDTYTVDFDVHTGRSNRWATQMGTPVLGLHDRATMDGRMLCHTSPVLEADLQVSGTPTVTVFLRCDRPDGVVLAYLEDVAPDGQSRYVTEGGLRLLHRKVVPLEHFDAHLPEPSYATAHGAPVEPGELLELRFALWPTSVRFAAGHRVRLALAGADGLMFDRLPAEGAMTWRVLRGGEHPSALELPVLPPAAAPPATPPVDPGR